ncbi:hypothetical protein BDZ45DRAFT_779181 [Acephala macrosclerotiorum]|nr:hypothetical protein BDZ45DRAFT_779181 [Acephala macrosclerotiorum]
MSKFCLFQLTNYSRILFLNADTFIHHSVDGIFSDPFSHSINTPNVIPKEVNEAPLPLTYLLATLPEVLHTTHPYPPRMEKFQRWLLPLLSLPYPIQPLPLPPRQYR